MPRYIRARRSRSVTTDTELNQLRDQFIRQLIHEAQTAMRDMSNQFGQELERQSSDFLSGLLGAEESGGTSQSAGLMKIASSASRYFFSRPRLSESSAESARSHEETDRFRVSQAQALAEANALMARGEKNS